MPSKHTDAQQESPLDPVDSTAASWSRVWIQWSAWLACIVVIELALSFAPSPASPWDRGTRFYPPSRIPSADDSVVQWQLDRLRTTAADLVLLGDSSALNGLVPAAFTERLGWSTQNYSTICWVTIDGHVDTLELYLRQHGAPRAVVYQMATLVHSVPDAHIRASGFRDRYKRYIGTSEASGLSMLPSYRWREVARELVEGVAVSDAIVNAPRGREPSDVGLREFLETNSGFNVDRSPRASWDGIRPLPPVMQQEALASLVRMFELSDAYRFRLYVVHNPLPVFLQHPQLDALYSEVERVVRDEASGHPHVTIVGPFARWFREEAFANVEHLIPEAAWAHSQWLAGIIERTIAAEGSGEPR